ncbi:sulfite exporter TauE/SafE family protein [Granulicatella seriolae]|uniref:Probable membrane transporter protein n=1 Tax=Granulicatella seriolae TaxID=2967226 RepID=A0ABT1WTD1_9LACT|nr:sulfite exporter TauE/SafE family protein [Granulicatella seriolae]
MANSIGAISGMGGGVIIKPIFDLIGAHDLATISFYSAVAVFTMSLTSTFYQIKKGTAFKPFIIFWVSLGAFIGGYFGNKLFDFMYIKFNDFTIINLIQIFLTIITLLCAYMYSSKNCLTFDLNTNFYYFICGLILGGLSSFLGIGGGPINVSLLILLFSMSIKEATFYSIATIFFSQLSKLITIGFTTGFNTFDLETLYFIIPAAILGGIIGANLSTILSERNVEKVFRIVILLVLFINIYNGINLFRTLN